MHALLSSSRELPQSKCQMDQEGELCSSVNAFSVFHLDMRLFLTGILADTVGIK